MPRPLQIALFRAAITAAGTFAAVSGFTLQAGGSVKVSMLAGLGASLVMLGSRGVVEGVYDSTKDA